MAEGMVVEVWAVALAEERGVEEKMAERGATGAVVRAVEAL